MMTEHREPSVSNSRSTSTARPPGSTSSATRASRSPCRAPMTLSQSSITTAPSKAPLTGAAPGPGKPYGVVPVSRPPAASIAKATSSPPPCARAHERREWRSER